MPGTLEVRRTDVRTARGQGAIPLAERAARSLRVAENAVGAGFVLR